MQYSRFGRALVPFGELFDTVDEAIQFLDEEELEPFTEQTQNLSFSTDDEGMLNILINNKRYFITIPALKDLCKMLKVPASYINKFPGSGLVLENLNNNPYLTSNSDLIKIILWKGEMDTVEYPVIAGVLDGGDPALPYRDYLSILQDENVFERDTTKLDHIALTSEEMVLYFTLPDEIARDGFSFKGGYSIHYSATRAVDTVFQPFFTTTIVSAAGEPFDFDYEMGKKLRIFKRKKEDFLNGTLENSYTYAGEDLGVCYEEAMKHATVSKNLNTIKFAVLKYLKGKAVSSYNYNGVKVDGNAVVEEVIPEFKEFMAAYGEQIKHMETYASNNLSVDFYLPIFYNRFFTFAPNIENPHFMIKYRKAIGACMNKILDEVGDLVVDMHQD